MAILVLALVGVFTLMYQGSAKGTSVCPGYRAKSVVHNSSGLTADLFLDGPPCHMYGKDIDHLTLTVEYQTGTFDQVGRGASCERS